MVMNFKVYDIDLHMSNHYKRINSAKSIINNSTPLSYKLKHKQYPKRPKSTSSSLNSLRTNDSYGVVTRKDQSGIPTATRQSLRSNSLPPKGCETPKSERSPQHLQCKSRNANSEIECASKKTPIPTPRISKKSTVVEIPEYEYIQFSLRITEDIIRNNLYAPTQMQRVFNSHLEANRGRLNTDKMLEQINKLSEELKLCELQKQEEKKIPSECSANICKSKQQVTPKCVSYALEKSSVLKSTEASKNSLMEKLIHGSDVINQEEIKQLPESDLQDIVSKLLCNETELTSFKYDDAYVPVSAAAASPNKKQSKIGTESTGTQQNVTNEISFIKEDNFLAEEKKVSVVLKDSEEEHLVNMSSHNTVNKEQNDFRWNFSNDNVSVKGKESVSTNESQGDSFLVSNLIKVNGLNSVSKSNQNSCADALTSFDNIKSAEVACKPVNQVELSQKTSAASKKQTDNEADRHAITEDISDLIKFSTESVDFKTKQLATSTNPSNNESHNWITTNDTAKLIDYSPSRRQTAHSFLSSTLNNIIEEVENTNCTTPCSTNAQLQTQDSFVCNKENSLNCYSLSASSEEFMASKIIKESETIPLYKPVTQASTQTTFSVENFLFLKSLQDSNSLDGNSASAEDISKPNVCTKRTVPDFISLMQAVSNEHLDALNKYFTQCDDVPRKKESKKQQNVYGKSRQCQVCHVLLDAVSEKRKKESKTKQNVSDKFLGCQLCYASTDNTISEKTKKKINVSQKSLPSQPCYASPYIVSGKSKKNISENSRSDQPCYASPETFSKKYKNMNVSEIFFPRQPCYASSDTVSEKSKKMNVLENSLACLVCHASPETISEKNKKMNVLEYSPACQVCHASPETVLKKSNKINTSEKSLPWQLFYALPDPVSEKTKKDSTKKPCEHCLKWIEPVSEKSIKVTKKKETITEKFASCLRCLHSSDTASDKRNRETKKKQNTSEKCIPCPRCRIWLDTVSDRRIRKKYSKRKNCEVFLNKAHSTSILKDTSHLVCPRKNLLVFNDTKKDIDKDCEPKLIEYNNIQKQNNCKYKLKQIINKSNLADNNNNDAISKQLETVLNSSVKTQTSFTSVSSFELNDFNRRNSKGIVKKTRFGVNCSTSTQTSAECVLSDGEIQDCVF